MSPRNQDAPVAHLLLCENRIMYRRLHMIDFFFSYKLWIDQRHGNTCHQVSKSNHIKTKQGHEFRAWDVHFLSWKFWTKDLFDRTGQTGGLHYFRIVGDLRFQRPHVRLCKRVPRGGLHLSGCRSRCLTPWGNCSRPLCFPRPPSGRRRPKQLQRVGPIIIQVILDLTLQHLDTTLATYIRKNLNTYKTHLKTLRITIACATSK